MDTSGICPPSQQWTFYYESHKQSKGEFCAEQTTLDASRLDRGRFYRCASIGSTPAPAHAAFDYNTEQIAPAVASQLTITDIAAILNETVSNPSSWEVFQLATTDASGHQVSVAP